MSAPSNRVAAAASRRDWIDARDALVAADEAAPLDAASLETLGLAWWWLGQADESIRARQRAFESFDGAGDRAGAARMALLLSEDHRRQARPAVADGWRRRAERLLTSEPECAEHGYLWLYQGERCRRRGQLVEARALLDRAAALAQRLEDDDLAVDVAQEIGRVTIMDGQLADGMAIMDEAMLAASDGGLTPYTVGKVYCCVMSACDDTGDIERLAQWRTAAQGWSDTHGLDVFPGMCRVHHAELLALLGRWSEAEQAALRACVELDMLGWVVAYAYNTLGHLHRCRGDLDRAEAAFREAEARGTVSESGLALVLLHRGDAEGASGRMRRALATMSGPALARVRLLPATVEIALAADRPDEAGVAAAELDEIAGAYGTAKFRAQAATARGRVALAAGAFGEACAALDVAMTVWTQVGAPYEIARTRMLQAQACELLGDDDGCRSQLRLAAATFGELGATRDLEEVERRRGGSRGGRGSLTEREVEVLRLLATGATNRQIATTLHLSEKTVSRHLGNIFTKIDVTTRSAATAYAYRTALVS